jgi:cell division protein FtsN
MSKDYKRPEPAARSGGSQLLVGILIGLVLGLGIALGVAWYINKMPNPFLARTPPAKLEPLKPAPPTTSKGEDKTARAPEPKLRFDFYKILPGTEETVTAPQAKDAKKPSTAAAGETFFLQAGAFQNPRDADTLRARLALLGVEARIQTATLPDKGVWHRVRVGPYTSVEELGRTRETLKQNGVETTLIKVRDERP